MVTCEKCGYDINEKDSLSEAKRKPCPRCGSFGRKLIRVINEEQSILERIRLKLRGSKIRKKRLSRELTQGHEMQRSTGKMMCLYRLIDRIKDLYHERIVDPMTGEVIHECKEKLSDHKDHGDAKKK